MQLSTQDIRAPITEQHQTYHYFTKGIPFSEHGCRIGFTEMTHSSETNLNVKLHEAQCVHKTDLNRPYIRYTANQQHF